MNLLSNVDDIEVIAQAKDGQETIDKARKLQPDVILIDIGMPVMNGIDATRILKEENRSLKIIAVSMHSDRQFVKGILEAGADGYLLKNCTYRQLIEAVHSVMSGKKYLSDEITGMIIQGYLEPSDYDKDGNEELSGRETEILKLYAEGKSTREISEKLFISVKTVGTHKQHILDKLKLNSNADIVKYALKRGWIHL